MNFRLVPKSATLNDLERCNGPNGIILHYFSEFGYLPGTLRKSSHSLSHLLMSSCLVLLKAFWMWNEWHWTSGTHCVGTFTTITFGMYESLGV